MSADTLDVLAWPLCFGIAAVIAYINHKARTAEWDEFFQRQAKRRADFERRLHERA